jgi:hypothetical protein
MTQINQTWQGGYGDRDTAVSEFAERAISQDTVGRPEAR